MTTDRVCCPSGKIHKESDKEQIHFCFPNDYPLPSDYNGHNTWHLYCVGQISQSNTQTEKTDFPNGTEYRCDGIFLAVKSNTTNQGSWIHRTPSCEKTTTNRTLCVKNFYKLSETMNCTYNPQTEQWLTTNDSICETPTTWQITYEQ